MSEDIPKSSSRITNEACLSSKTWLLYYWFYFMVNNISIFSMQKSICGTNITSREIKAYEQHLIKKTLSTLPAVANKVTQSSFSAISFSHRHRERASFVFYFFFSATRYRGFQFGGSRSYFRSTSGCLEDWDQLSWCLDSRFFSRFSHA